MLCIFFYVTVAVLALPLCEGIKCYRCNVKPPSRVRNETNRPCVSFTPSKEYEVDCPDSTLCMKHTYKLPLQNSKYFLKLLYIFFFFFFFFVLCIV
jgi:hypothetical protein